jgi:hypothetical protein
VSGNNREKAMFDKNHRNTSIHLYAIDQRELVLDLADAARAFVEAWDKSHQLEKTDIALRMTKAILARVDGSSE